MSFVRTVQKDIESAALGWCQCHEHLFIEKGPSCDINPALFMDDREKGFAEVKRYREAGGCSLVDAQPMGCGRMAEHLQYVSEISGVNIIASTGFHKLEFYPEDSFVLKQTAERLAQLFSNEINIGMFSSLESGCRRLACRAGIIKTAADDGGIHKNKHYGKLFEAAAAVSRRTGVPVLCHMEKGADAFELIAFFERYGVAPRKLLLCHLDRMRYDFAYHEVLAQTGVYLEYDTICRLKYHDNGKEIALIRHMVEKGYTDRLLLSLDTTRSRLKSYGGGIGLDYLLTDFKGLLKDNGLDESTLNQLMRVNPQNALAVNIL